MRPARYASQDESASSCLPLCFTHCFLAYRKTVFHFTQINDSVPYQSAVASSVVIARRVCTRDYPCRVQSDIAATTFTWLPGGHETTETSCVDDIWLCFAAATAPQDGRFLFTDRVVGLSFTVQTRSWKPFKRVEKPGAQQKQRYASFYRNQRRPRRCPTLVFRSSKGSFMITLFIELNN